MPKFSVRVNRTQATETSVEVEVTAKDAEDAEVMVQEQIEMAAAKANLNSLNWQESSYSDDF